MPSLNGKTALVTGGSRGIGAAIALRLAADGADVAITFVRNEDAARDVVAKIESTGRRGFALRADAADPGDAAGAVERAADDLGRLDILVNNAGIGVLGPIGDLALADVDRVLAVNVRSVFLASQAAAGRLARRRPDHLHRHGAHPVRGRPRRHALRAEQVGADRHDQGAGPRARRARDHREPVHPGPIDTDMNPADGPFAEPQKNNDGAGPLRLGRRGGVARRLSRR